MAYEPHPLLDTPPDNTVLWRYLDFTKLVSMIEDSAIYFAHLSEFEDPLEGFLTNPTVAKFRNFPEDMSDEERARRTAVGKHNLGMLKWAREQITVSCWHENEHESAAMWRLYLKSSEGIALRTTVGQLKAAFEVAQPSVHIARVKYVDYDSDEIEWNNALYLALHKRRSFDHEREIRAIAMTYGGMDSQYVKVRLDQLCETVFVAPGSPTWYLELVKKVVTRGLPRATICRSGLEDGPLY